MTELSPKKTGFADLDEAEIYYEIAGAGHPLLLLHAGVADSRMWDEQFGTFARHYQAIRYDLPGFGKSRLLRGPFSLHEQAASLLRFLGAERAHVAGTSFGGLIALDLALARPEMVSALILVCPSVSGENPSDAVRQFGAEEEALLERGDLTAATELNLRMWVDGPRRMPDQVNPAVRERVREMQYHAFTIPEPEGIEERPLIPPAIGRLAEVRAPTLIVVGDYDIEEKLKLADRLAAEISGARKVIVPGAAHMVTMEQPEVFNRIALDFLSQQ
ncbi:MAG TPA: alpha/beta fold hydrolase [Roseiflexaceae bacterium]